MNKLTLQIYVSILWLQAQANLNDLANRLKKFESANADLARRNDELTGELQNANGENGRLNAELARLKVVIGELQEKNDALARENRQLSGKSS